MGFPGIRGQCRIMGMNAILDVPEIRAQVHRWTVADYRALAEDRLGYERSELIRGIIVEKRVAPRAVRAAGEIFASDRLRT